MYDIETFNKNRTVPYCSCIFKLSKISRKYHRDISEQEYQKCLNGCVVFKGTDCINETLDHVLSFKGEPKKINNKIVEYNLYLIAHSGSGFDSFVVLNNLPQWRSVVKLIKNGAVIISIKIFNGYVDPNKKIPQYVHFRRGRVHIIRSVNKIGDGYRLQESLLKKEIEHDEHDEVFEHTWEAKEHEWLTYFKNDVLSTAFCYARYTMGMKELTGFGMKNSLTLPSLANKYFNSLGDEKDEPIYTYTDPFMRNFVRQSIKEGRCIAFAQPYQSEISDEVFDMISKELKVNSNICDILEKYFEFINKYDKQCAKEYNSEYDDYRDIDQKN